jgi:putative ABC transport system permease protein
MVIIIVAFCGLAYLGGALIAPALVLLAGRAAERVSERVPWFPVRMAIDNLPRDPRRSGATVGTIIVAMAIAANVAGTVASFNHGVLDWIEQHFASDLFVGAGARFQLFGGNVMQAALADTLRAVHGVARVEPFRVRRILFENRPTFLQGVSVVDRLALGGLPMVEGTFADAAPGLRAGTGVLLSDNLAFSRGLHRGDTVALPTPHGDRRFRVEGTYTDYLGSIDLGAVVVDVGQLETIWDDQLVNLFRLWLSPGASPGDVRGAVLRRLGADHGYYVITAGEFLDRIRGLVRGFFLGTWAMQVVAALVGIIGVVNAQLATVLDRASEIRTLRTIGVSRRDVTRSTVAECAMLGVLGGAGGVALGTMLSAEMVTVALRLVTGWRLPFTVPVGTLFGGVLAAALVSAVAGWVPARAAARIEGGRVALD